MNKISEANAEQTRRWPFLFIVGLSDAMIFVLIAWKRHTGILDSSAAILSCWISIALLTAIWIAILWLRRPDHPTGVELIVSVGILAAAAVTGLLTAVVVRSMPSADLTFALSGRPLSQITSPQRRLLIQLLRTNNVNSKEYASIAAHWGPINPPLYSADSFADKRIMQKTLNRLNAAYQQDLEYAAKQRNALQDFQSKMTITDPQWLASWKRSDLPRETAQNQQLELEKQWITSANALYGWARDHLDKIQLVGGVLKFSSPTIEDEFRGQMEASKRLQHRVREARQQLVRDQHARRDTEGLN